MFEKLIYLASPYSHPDEQIKAYRFFRACEATARLQDEGHLVFSPIVHAHYLVPYTAKQGGAFSDWEALDKAFIDRCDEVWVLEIDGWQESKGVTAEIAYARSKAKPVRFVDPLKLIARTQGDLNSEVQDVFGYPRSQADGYGGAE